MGLQKLNEEKLKAAKVIIGERIHRRLSQTLARRLGVTQQCAGLGHPTPPGGAHPLIEELIIKRFD